jgi:molecular chaperone HtpG
MRASARRVDTLQTLRRWIVFPRCVIEARVDQEPPISIGYSSPAHAIRKYVEQEELGIDRNLIEVIERRIGSATLAFAMVYNSHYRDRQFVQLSERIQERIKNVPPIGICIEGIRVEFWSPGFMRTTQGFLSIVNYTGLESPKTNVARSSLESDTDRSRIAGGVYRSYLDQVQEEIGRLQLTEGFSLSYAVGQFPFIAGPLLSEVATDLEVRKSALKTFPMFMVEDEKGRRAASASELISIGGFWSVESSAMRSLIELLNDSPPEITCKQVVEFSKFRGSPLPSGSLVMNAQLSLVSRTVLESEFEVCELNASIRDRRLDARWRPREDKNSIWIDAAPAERDVAREILDEMAAFRRNRHTLSVRIDHPVLVASKALPVFGLEEHCAVLCLGGLRLLPGTELAAFLLRQIEESSKAPALIFYLDALTPLFGYSRQAHRTAVRGEIESLFRETLARFEGRIEIDSVGFLEALSKTEERLSTFDPWSWLRGES